LGIAVGMRVYALIKSVSIDMLKTEATHAQEAR